jgi:UDP-2-acetamido-3-amino-2,3-dideoxy-glucuronate N-acetyltransferase
MEQQTLPAVALVGCGQWGRNIARALSGLGALKLVCDPDAAAVEPFARSLGADFTTDMDQALNGAFDAVALATPAITHAQVAQKALRAGKHVYVEKPIALSTADAEATAAVAAETGRVLMIGHLLQYHPVFVKLLKMVRAGELGTLQYLYSNRLNQGRVRTEENALWSLAPHDYSMILALAGAAPMAVSAAAQAAIQPGIPDIAVANIEFHGGLKAHIFCSWLNAYKEHRLTVIGSKGMAVFTDSALSWDEKLLFYPHTVIAGPRGPEFKKAEGRPVVVPQGEPLKAEMQHFLESVVTGAPVRTGPDEAIPVLKLLEATQRAIDSAKRVELA